MTLSAWSRSRRVPLILLCCFALLAWLIHAVSQMPLSQEGDYAWYLDAARHVLAGRGLTSSASHPVFLNEAAPLDAQPFVVSPPLHPLMLSAFMLLLGTNDLAGVAYGAAAYLCFVAAATSLAFRLTESRWLAAASGSLVALEPSVLRHSVTAGSDLLPAAGAVALFVISMGHTRPAIRSWSAGLLLGLLQLVRFSSAAFLPALLVVVRLKTRSWRPVVVALTAFLLIQLVAFPLSPRAPTLPVYLVAGIPSWPGFTIQGATPPVDVGFMQAHASELLYKWVSSIRPNYFVLSGAMAPFVGGIGILGYVLLARRRKWCLAASYAGTLLISLFAVTSLTVLASRVYLPLVPFVYIGAVGLLARMRSLRHCWILLVLVLMPLAADVAKGIRDEPARAARAQGISRIVTEVGERTSRDSWIATDIAELLAWRTARDTLRIPDDPVLLARPQGSQRSIDFVLLTSELSARSDYVRSPAWAEALASGRLDGFEMVWSATGAVEAKLFQRRK